MTINIATRRFMYSVIGLGAFCFIAALLQFPVTAIGLPYLCLLLFSALLSPYVTVQIPRFRSYVSVSDTLVFLTLILFGGVPAIVLSAIDAFFMARRLCKLRITMAFNVGCMALSTSIVVAAFYLIGIDPTQISSSGNIALVLSGISVAALVQFAVNSGLASMYGAYRNNEPFWLTWKNNYSWTSLTYVVGALTALLLSKLVVSIGFGIVLAALPIIGVLYFSYKMYLQNVEITLAQARQATQHASVLEEQSRQLRESEERFRSAFTYAPIGIGLVSPDGSWLKVNKALSDILRYDEEEFLATDFQSMIHREDLGDVLVMLHELIRGNVPSCQLDQRFVAKTGEIVWSSWNVSTVSDGSSERPNLIFQIQDITAKKTAEEQLQYKATHDALTGLPNRALFMNRLRQALDKCLENRAYNASVLFIDMDRFKIVNDSLGHLFGDELLVAIAERLRECLRPSDMVARLGGDEFTILVQGQYDINEVVRIAERIKEKFTTPFSLSGHEVYSSASIGILHRSDLHTSAEDMMRDADIAMYQAKRAGKARHAIFDHSLHDAIRETLRLETDLRRAIQKDLLEVHYQPIYEIASGKVLGFEALARWDHETEGFIPPIRFIPLAEEVGLIDILGAQILRKACLQGKRLRAMFPKDAPFILSINLSCKQFANPALVENIERVLAETSFSPRDLKFEITESLFLEHREHALDMLNRLCSLGIKIDIDDFGTGYSNLGYLTRLPISTLKIDRSFVHPIDIEGRNLEIVETIINLARSLGMKVIAEGVETEAQLSQLKRLHCEGAQGFLLARPMSFENASLFLEDGLGRISQAPLPINGEIETISILQ